MFYKIVIYTLLCNTLVAVGLPQTTLSMHKAADNFQNAVQQQTFQNVLLAIEERLRNLDNIYSMQLSETIKSKLDQYQRKLESLDLKIIRLESLVMLHLNKISENISTKNYKDDIALTQVYRKLDNIYDGLSHRINYMDKKADMTFEKLQNKIDTTLIRIEKMEENMMQRNSDIEAELSETLFVIEDLKISSENTEQSLLNITTILNQTVSNVSLMNSINLSMENLIKDLNQSFSQRLEKVENATLRNLNVSEENNDFLKSMKLELKEDFNEYANKVADMNVDVWKRKDVADESLKTIEIVTNSTRIEVQNGVRALIVQIGKLSGKSPINNDKMSLESLNKSVKLSLEKIITNQELFLESCHRVQMDESQIESEISVMLGKLIDMLEKKMTTVMKDIKSLEKTVKNHDSRTTRNIYQANSNIVSLVEKVTRSSETTEKELQEITFYINSLFTLVQDVMPKSIGVNGINQNIEILFNDLSNNITNFIKNMNFNSDIKWIQLLERNFTKHHNLTEIINDQVKNISNMLVSMKFINHKNASNEIDCILEEKINTSFGRINSSNEKTDSNFSTADLNISKKNSDVTGRHNCTPGYANLIDLRADGLNCNDNSEDTTLNANTTLPLFIINSSSNRTDNNEEKIIGNSITLRPQDDEQIKKTILEIFGTPPPSLINASTENTFNKTELTVPDKQKKCIPAWANLINIRADSNENIEECVNGSTSIKKIRVGKIKASFNVDDLLEQEDTTKDVDGSTEDPLTTENLTENNISTETIELKILEQHDHI